MPCPRQSDNKSKWKLCLSVQHDHISLQWSRLIVTKTVRNTYVPLFQGLPGTVQPYVWHIPAVVVVVVVGTVVVVTVVVGHRVSCHCVTPGLPYCFCMLARLSCSQQPALSPPVASQSTATHRGSASHAARQASSVVTPDSLLAPSELVLGNERHGTQTPDTVDVVGARRTHNLPPSL